MGDAEDHDTSDDVPRTVNLTTELHCGGITEVFSMPSRFAQKAVLQLMTCVAHDRSHVFVVDQSRWPKVQIGVSVHGAQCLRDAGLLRSEPT